MRRFWGRYPRSDTGENIQKRKPKGSVRRQGFGLIACAGASTEIPPFIAGVMGLGRGAVSMETLRFNGPGTCFHACESD